MACALLCRLFYGAQNATAELGEALIAYSEELKRAIEVDVSAYFDGLEEYDPPRYKADNQVNSIQLNKLWL